ncbi:putative isochorismate synthase [Helianthus anomalus]
MEPDSTKSNILDATRNTTVYTPTQRYNHFCSLSMNGCQSRDPRTPVGMTETRTFPFVSTPAMAMERLSSAITELGFDPPVLGSGIIRLEVPIEQQIEAIDWLHGQQHFQHLPRCFFSGRNQRKIINGFPSNSVSSLITRNSSPVSTAGLGSAVFFRHVSPFSLHDWRSIKRFLSKKCPLIRAYGAIRFDALANISSEWEAFGSFFFMIPQVEFNEFEGSSMLVTTIAWDESLSWTFGKAVHALQATMSQVSSSIVKLRKEVPNTSILSSNNVPSKKLWDVGVDRALQMINKNNSPLIKVVLARSSVIRTSPDIDPLTWLATLQVESENAYQFCLQPPDAPSFIGNTPEQLFHRNRFDIYSEAMAGTRARGDSKALDLQIALDLLYSSKDDKEFSIVRECIKRNLEAVCTTILVEPEKTIRKLSRVQHLYARIRGRLRSEDDEFDILSSLHPTPAVCGFPTEEARVLIAETEKFDRGMYAGPVGWFGGGESEFAVGIRSALVQKGLGALIYAGTGIVEGSCSSQEWDELELKTSQFTKLMNWSALS